MRLTKKVWLWAIGLSLLVMGLTGLLAFQYLFSYFTIDCDSNRQFERMLPASGQIDTARFERLQIENISRLSLIGSVTANNQDVIRAKPVFSPDGRYLALGGVSAARSGSTTNSEACGNLWLWDLQSGEISVLRLTEGRPTVTSLSFSPDSTALYTREHRAADSQYSYHLWSIHNGAVAAPEPISESTAVVNIGPAGNTITYKPDSNFNVFVAESSVVFAAASTGERLRMLPDSAQFSAVRIAASPDQKLLVIGGNDYTSYWQGGQVASIVQIWGVPNPQ